MKSGLIRNLFMKLKESLFSVLPIYIAVFVIQLLYRVAFGTQLLDTNTLIVFSFSGAILVIGMTLFNIGAESSMIPMGENMTSSLIGKRLVYLLIIVCLIFGIAISIAEPDLSVLANQLEQAIPHRATVITIALGVGLMLGFSVLRTFLKMKLKYLIFLFYGLVFILMNLTNKNIIPVAFDSGGVTTGPVTTPFILALGIGLATVTTNPNIQDDNFGTVGLCSVGPILAMLILGMFFNVGTINEVSEATTTFLDVFVKYLGSVGIAIGIILGIYLLLQVFVLRLPWRKTVSILIGCAASYIGLVLFLSAAECGLLPAGQTLGQTLGAKASDDALWKIILIVIAFVFGLLAVLAEPAVQVLNKLIAKTSGGIVSKSAMLISLTIGVGTAVALATAKILYKIDFTLIISACYGISLVLAAIVDDVFVGIAFDSGGVASGPMASSFILPFVLGVCSSQQLDLLTNGFGVVALIAVTPLITVQLLGLVVKIKSSRFRPIYEDRKIIKFYYGN